ncbi:hypothetical protein [Streptomyces carpaticus]|uniref:hypothetical protein n=1 Tax=Streptomyces carpaticus TaxID=285558 RepID=UPI0031F7A920
MGESDGPVYEVVFAGGRRGLTHTAVALAAAAVLPFLSWYEAAVPMAVVLGLYGLGRLAVVMCRQVAFRVDRYGVVLGGALWRHRAHTAAAPWQDIEAIVVWEHSPSLPKRRSLLLVGLRRRPGAPPLPGPGRVPSPSLAALASSWVEPETQFASRLMFGWRLDYRRLVAARDAFAPQVRIEDTSGRFAPGIRRRPRS